MHSIDSNSLERREQEREQDLVRHHHYIACKNYDRTIMTHKLNYLRSLPLQYINKNSPRNKNRNKNKRIILVEDEADTALLFKMVLESDARLKVDSFTDSCYCTQ